MRRIVAAAPLVLLALAGCGGPDAAPDDAAAEPLPAGIEAAFEEHGMAGLTGKEIVDHLDRLTGPERPTDLMASVRADELVVSDGVHEAAVALPDDEFYLSFAPYVDATHECYFHSLTTCQGELTGQDVEVRIVADDGEVLVDEVATTFGNGFVGYWLPRDIDATIEVGYEGLTGELDIATDASSPTCLTTIQLA
ncbi:CueP family metal-binding protein [Georgenia sp. MJ170]|uniref:CueP family metal-binding protein n=1 Tax=Georgenia sunbinii TaxID=3117728 RepID=UPI002F260FEC